MQQEERIPWDAGVTCLNGVGRDRALLLARLGIETVGQLLTHPPRRHEDRRAVIAIRDLTQGQPALVRGTIVAAGLKRWRHGTRSQFELVLDDGTRRLHCHWWNQPYLDGVFQTGQELFVYGRVTSLRPPTLEHPETEVIEGDDEERLHVGRLVPVYPLTEGMTQRWLRRLIWRTLRSGRVAIPEPLTRLPVGGLPPGMPATRAEALHKLHFPDHPAEPEEARRRLALEELIALREHLEQRRARLLARAPLRPCPGDNRFIRPFLKQLGFRLTPAQAKVLAQIRSDLTHGRPMRRLLQGDVGCGKTVVAACTALMALESGYAVALMAPTEILAEQHFQNFSRWFPPLGIPVQLRTAHRRETAPGPDRTPALIIGTHTLIQSGETLEHLGLAIIDEQHRFGVVQRETLVRKGDCPHLLVMTATPIPRTLGLTLYGDLDLSVIDQPPAGRLPIRTFVRRTADLDRIWAFVKDQMVAGRQAYVVCPRIDGTETDELKAVNRLWKRLQTQLRPARVGLLHGRLAPEAKDQVMTAFQLHELDLLVTTTVIEVGIDIPNATVLVVLEAESYGLAQLHQLRGRVGRGGHASWCILVAGANTATARRRLAVLELHADGFAVAEEDLRLRGAGELLGRDQSGAPPFRFADLTTDRDLVEFAAACTSETPHPGR